MLLSQINCPEDRLTIHEKKLKLVVSSAQFLSQFYRNFKCSSFLSYNFFFFWPSNFDENWKMDLKKKYIIFFHSVPGPMNLKTPGDL